MTVWSSVSEEEASERVQTTARRPLWRSILRATWYLIPLALGLGAGALVSYELENSTLQARYFSQYIQQLDYELRPGPSPRIAFPSGGPFNQRRGYARLPELLGNLREHGFSITEQVQMNAELAQLIEGGIAPPYPEPSVAGLLVRTADGAVLRDARDDDRVFTSFAQIPDVIIESLLFIENKELLKADRPRHNPTLEWDRLVKATMLYSASRVGFSVDVEGGSTLATQLEKFRHSPAGRTSSPAEKLRQIISASLKAYRDGEDTTLRRREIVVEYLNSMPLAAAPRYGEVHGLGEGLAAWFGLSLHDVVADLDRSSPLSAQARAFNHVLALIAALPAPSTYLLYDRPGLERRMASYATLLERAGILDPELARAVREQPLDFVVYQPEPPTTDYVDRKAITAARKELLNLTGVPTMYELDQLHLESEFTIDTELQAQVVDFFRSLADPDFVRANGLTYKYLLRNSDPSKVLYSLILYERTPQGDLLRVQADSLDQPFDLNRGAKIELGSTAKLRTMAHYLEIIAMLYEEMASLDTASLRIRSRAGRDPLTRWVADELSAEERPDLAELLDRALDRKYSAWSGESFLTGGGLRRFMNFGKVVWRMPTMRLSFHHSINLPFIRLMRDIMLYHRARLEYDADLVLSDPTNEDRIDMLTELAEQESRVSLARAYRKLAGLDEVELVKRVVRRDSRPSRRLRKVSILYFAWHPAPTMTGLRDWLALHFGETSEAEVLRMWRAYGNPGLSLQDYAYLMSRRPLEIWCGGKLLREPDLTWDEILRRSVEARHRSYRWLFQTRNSRAQARRLNVRIERDAFERMTPYWRRLGFPFSQLVPSYATSIGSSGDRPAALAELVGIILNDGILKPPISISELRFARGTPYETAMAPDESLGERVMEVEVARALRKLMSGVVAEGTGMPVSGVFYRGDGRLAPIGGKTGTGDNRRKTFNRWGELRTSHAVNRTASFVFFIDRYYGVLTAIVPGRDAEHYTYTSKLPLRVLRLMAPMINRSLRRPTDYLQAADEPRESQQLQAAADTQSQEG